MQSGAALNFDEEKAKEILKEDEVRIKVDFNQGTASDRIWTCDFSYDYVVKVAAVINTEIYWSEALRN